MVSPVAVICGSAAGMWHELAAVVTLVGTERELRLAALNFAGVFVPHVDEWFITTMDNVQPMSALRERVDGDRSCAVTTIHTPGHELFPVMHEKHRYWSIPTKGTIAMFAVKVLSSMGYNRMILAGVPLDDKAGYFYKAPWEKFGMSKESKDYWAEAASQLKPYVRSMGGWTQELLGAPDEAWLQGGH